MGDNTSTEKREDPNLPSKILELWGYRILGSSTERAARAAIHALDGSKLLRSTPKNLLWVEALLAGHPDRIRRNIGVRKQVFEQLVRELSALGHTQSEGITLEEQLAIFLYMCTTGHSCRRIGERINRSSVTIKKHFYKILEAFSSPPIFTKYVKLPRVNDPTPTCTANDPLMYPFFKDAIGAMDCMQVMCAPPGTTKSAYRNRRGFYSQHCLVCCNFNLEFTYIVSGREGSAADDQVYCDARENGLRIPAGKYYLADVVFPTCPQLLVPYSIQHHLPALEHEEMRPTNTHDYFNLRHAQLRSVIERAIHLLKRRFRILMVAPEYDMDSQARIPSALCCIHNIIRCCDPEDMEENEKERVASDPPSDATSVWNSEDELPKAYDSMVKSGSVSGDERDTMVERRETIASLLWRDHLDRYPCSQDRDASM